ncbi:phage tail protein [Billgrantia gudaonensis]|uniref:P2 phage tail completion protein R (GpR) n=1 Tax=Billgrantia gudaonensis TaxID=376427 RepID=A0A1G8TKK6_9GAMM|nr:phage tail protein [Halomonas gudaonensis]SDJ41435.1 P2 phage tail completion protein R (GpR) [Halomonas gudaonensis]
MNKLHALRKHLIDAVPELKRGPEKLLTFVQDGTIAFARGQHLSHEYRVDAQLVVTDYSGSLDTLMIPLLQWLSRYQPDLEPDEAIRLEAEILSNQSWDLALTVRLTERVVALVDCDAGTINAEHRMPAYPIEACPALSWQLHVKAPGDDDYRLASEWESPTDGG